jgi:hypothetical protein
MERDGHSACNNVRIRTGRVRSVKWQAWFASFAVVVCLSSGAWAQDDAPDADDIRAAAEEFDLGRRAFKAKDYVEAAEHFEAADSRAPSATALELAVRARDRAGQLERAATLAALAQARHPDEDFTKKLAPGILKRAGEELHSVSARCDSPCELVVDTKLVHGKPATERVVFISPGKHTVRAAWSGGRTSGEDLEATAGGKSELSFTAPPEPEPEKAAPAADKEPVDRAETEAEEPARDHGAEAKGGWSPVVFYVGAGLTAVATGITIWSGIDTQNNPGADAVKQQCVGLGTGCPAYQEGRDKQLRTNVLIGVTATLAVATAVVGIVATDWSGGADKAAVLPRRRPPARSAGLWHGVEPWIGVDRGVTLGGARGRF